jgi:hypothetical protein
MDPPELASEPAPCYTRRGRIEPPAHPSYSSVDKDKLVQMQREYGGGRVRMCQLDILISSNPSSHANFLPVTKDGILK